MLQSDSMALCPNCSNQLPDGNAICLSCGAVIDISPKFNAKILKSERVVRSCLGSTLREDESEAESETDYKKRDQQ